MTRYRALGALCGLAWGGLAWVLCHKLMGRPTVGGVLVSPLIGLLMSDWAIRHRPASALWRALFALLALYNAALLFGAGVGLYDGLVGNTAHRDLWTLVAQDAMAVLWGLTFTGYVIFLWPLAAWSQALLWRLGPGPADGEPPGALQSRP